MITTRLMRLAVLAMLIFSLSAVPVTAGGSMLTPELLSKILDLIARRGIDRDIPSILANGLGLSAPGQAWPSRQITIDETGTKIQHGVAVSRGSDQDIIFNRRSPDSIRVFRLRRDGTLTTAVIYDIQTRQLTARDRAEAQRELDAEFPHWNVFKEPDQPK